MLLFESASRSKLALIPGLFLYLLTQDRVFITQYAIYYASQSLRGGICILWIDIVLISFDFCQHTYYTITFARIERQCTFAQDLP